MKDKKHTIAADSMSAFENKQKISPRNIENLACVPLLNSGIARWME